MPIVVLHLTAVAALTGLVWAVQLLVYPAFLVVGPTPAWPEHHARHSARIAAVLLVPWAVQGATLAWLLLRPPPGVPSWLVVLAAALGLGTVVHTVAVAVPLHRRLGSGFSRPVAERLVRTNRWRTALWTAGLVCAVAMALRAR